MAKIHWIIYIAVGLLVSVLSKRLNYDKLIFFFYAGLAFILVGVVKLVYSLRKKDERRQTAQNKRQSAFGRQQNNLQQRAVHHLKRCPRCGNIARINDRFCNKCGSRF